MFLQIYSKMIKGKLFILFLISINTMTQSQTISSKLMPPPSLKKGDTIAIVAPAGILIHRKHIIDKAKNLAESWGLQVVYGKNMFHQNHHFAGTDQERCQDFQDALNNKNIKAIWCARGGYGSVRILDLLDFSKFKENPKWVIGYSDITAFHNHIHNLGVETLHAMMGSSMQDKFEDIINTIASFKKVLFGESLTYKISSSKYNREGERKGILVGGNITLLASMLGSVSQISTKDKVLFIEEIGEYKYAIDRMLQSLKRAGYFNGVQAIIVGEMTNIKKNKTSWGSSIEELILAVVPKEIPVIFNFPAGHDPDNRALIMGRTVKVTIKKEGMSELSFE